MKTSTQELLESNAVAMQEFSYFKQISEEELNDHKENYFANMATIDTARNALGKAKEIFKEAVKIPSSDASKDYEVIKDKGIHVTEQVYLIPNYDTMMMDYTNVEGTVVFSRKLQANERQMFIKTAANE